MAEYVLLPRNSINYRVPPSIPAAHAAYIEPLACAIHAVQRGQIEFGDVVVIAGAGPLGLGMVAAARLKNPRLVISLDRIERRLAAARACGADLVFNVDDTDVVAEVRRLTGSYGCDVYIEAAGEPSAVLQGIQMVRPLGRYVQFSLLREPATVDWTIIGDQKELTIYGAHLGPYCYPIAMDMLAKGLVPMDQIITHRLPLAEFQQGLDLVSEKRHSIKVVLQP
jgi:threonine dehydrogenase-like Zn-dependent dehydrogenase